MARIMNPGKRRTPLAGDPSYDVGYCKAPVSGRFRKGSSGNPHGRPRGSKKSSMPSLYEERLKSIILKEAYRTIRVTEGDRQVTLSMAETVMRSIAVNAAKGHARAQKLFTELVHGIERADAELHARYLDAALDYKISWERELEQRQKHGIVAEAPLPHPDDIIIDMRTGVVRVLGPSTKEERLVFDQAIRQRDDLAIEFAAFVAHMTKARGARRTIARGQAIFHQTLYERYNDVLPPRLRKPLPGRLILNEEERSALAQAQKERASKSKRKCP